MGIGVDHDGRSMYYCGRKSSEFDGFAASTVGQNAMKGFEGRTALVSLCRCCPNGFWVWPSYIITRPKS